MRTIQVAERLGLTVHQVMHLVHEHGIQIPKDGGRFAWTEEAVEELRAALREREARREPPRQGLSSREAAERLGISYSRLIDLVRERQIPVPRIGPSQVFDFDEASLERVREILAQPPAPPRRSGLMTREVATALGVTYEVLMKTVAPLRKTLPIEKEGGSLLWSADAVRIVREALERRQELQRLGEPEDYDQAVRGVATLGAALQKLAAETRKLQGVLARKPAETALLNSLPTRTHVLRAPVGVLLIPVARKGFQASLPELALITEGQTRQEALRLMRKRLWARYREVSAAPGSARDEWIALQQIIVPR
jgi:transposase